MKHKYNLTVLKSLMQMMNLSTDGEQLQYTQTHTKYINIHYIYA